MNNKMLELAKELKADALLTRRYQIARCSVWIDQLIDLCEHVEKISQANEDSTKLIEAFCADDAEWHKLLDAREQENSTLISLIVKLVSSESFGLHIDADTVLWWMKQSAEARSAIVDVGYWLDESLGDLNLFAERVLTDDVQVWGNGVDFDNVILRNAYNAVDLEPFWKYWNNCCVRTIVELGRNAGIDPKRTLAFEGEPHNVLDDAIHQAKYVSIIHQHLIKPVNDDI